MITETQHEIICKNQRKKLCSDPLQSYFYQQPICLELEMDCMPLFSDYTCTWEIKIGQLWLIDFHSILLDGEVASIETVFPNQGGKVFADWYTGSLRVPLGELLEHKNQYEYDLFIEIEAGAVTRVRLVENGISPFSEVQTRQARGRVPRQTIDERFPLKAGSLPEYYWRCISLKDSGLPEKLLEQFLTVYSDERTVSELVTRQLAVAPISIVLEDEYLSSPVWLAAATPDIPLLRTLILSHPPQLVRYLYAFVAKWALRAVSKTQARHFVKAWTKAVRVFHNWESDSRDAVRPYLQVLACLRTVVPLKPNADWLTLSILGDDSALLDDLLALGTNPNARDSQGRLPLVEACARPWGRPFFERLLAAGADINGTDIFGNTPLLAVVITQDGTEEIAPRNDLDDLLSYHKDVLKVDPFRLHDRSTPLMQAVLLDKPGYLRRLLYAGANPYLTNNERENALDLIQKNSQYPRALALIFEEVYADLWQKKHAVSQTA